MNKNNNTVDTAQKGQATKKDKTPIGKVTLMKDTEARKKVREEQFRNFRINALTRRCKRMGMTDEKIEELIEKLKKQMDAPKEYHILVMFGKSIAKLVEQAIANNDIKYNYRGDTFYSIDGNQDVLAKLREVIPAGANIHPYAKKMESVIPKDIGEKKKKHTNNTAEKKSAAKTKRKELNKTIRAVHKKRKGKAFAKQMKRKTLLEVKKVNKTATFKAKVKHLTGTPKKESAPMKKAA